jgi:hypothetical protein
VVPVAPLRETITEVQIVRARAFVEQPREDIECVIAASGV